MAFPPARRDLSPEVDKNAQVSENKTVRSEEDQRDAHDLKNDFNGLMIRYQRQIYNTVLRLIGDPDEANDLTQETFVSAYRASKEFRGDSKVSTWLYRIAVNHCKNRFKQRSRHREHEGPSLDEGYGNVSDDPGGASESREVADWSMSPEVLVEQQELKAAIYRAIEALAPEYRTVLVLRELDSMNYNEIVEVTGLTLETVKTRLSRARAMVRRRLEPYYRMP